jgi:hypothetical protein
VSLASPDKARCAIFTLAQLGSHTILAVVIVPLILTTLYRAWRGRFERHKKMDETAFDLSVGWRRDPTPARSKKGRRMTLMDVAFRYGAQPGETQMRAIGSVREVYGIRRIAFNEKERTLRVEYDASHLSESVVAGLVRSAGIDLLEKVALT